MGATLTFDDPELAPVLSGTHLPTSEGWKTELAWQHEGDLVMRFTRNQTQATRMVAQWFTHYATVKFLVCNNAYDDVIDFEVCELIKTIKT